jgi:hypothetical protein
MNRSRAYIDIFKDMQLLAYPIFYIIHIKYPIQKLIINNKLKNK